MNMNKNEINALIGSVVNEMLLNGPIDVDSAIHVCMDRLDITHDLLGDVSNKYFVIGCVYESIDRSITSIFNKSKLKKEIAGMQPSMFPDLQVAYNIKRGGVRVIVALEQMTPDEIIEKINDLRKQQSGLEKHINQLSDFLERVHNIVI